MPLFPNLLYTKEVKQYSPIQPNRTPISFVMPFADMLTPNSGLGPREVDSHPPSLPGLLP